jgi:hypothetical protein
MIMASDNVERYSTESYEFSRRNIVPEYVSLSNGHSELAKLAFASCKETAREDDTWGGLQDEVLCRIVFEEVVPVKSFARDIKTEARRARGLTGAALGSKFEPNVVLGLSAWQLRLLQQRLELTNFEIQDWADGHFASRMGVGDPPLDSRLAAALQQQETVQCIAEAM